MSVEPARVTALREQADQTQELIDALAKLPPSVARDARVVTLTERVVSLQRQLRDAQNRAHTPAVTAFGELGWHDVASGR